MGEKPKGKWEVLMVPKCREIFEVLVISLKA